MYDNKVVDMVELFDDSDNSCVICDDKQMIIWSNESALVDSLPLGIHTFVKDFWKEKDEAYQLCMNALVQKAVFRGELIYFSMVYIIKVKPFVGDDHKLYSIWILRRKTSAKTKSEYVTSAQMMAQSKSYYEGIFNIYNMLAPISSVLEQEGKFEALTFVNAICRYCQQMLKMTINFNEYLKFQENCNVMNPMLVSLQQEMTDFVFQINFLLKGTDASIVLDVEGNDFFVQLDMYKFLLAILNIINNSLNYAMYGSGIHMLLKRTEKHVILTIRDVGEGMTPDLQSVAFKDCFSNVSSMEGEDRFGIGLYLTRLIIEAHGGSVLLSSRQDVGTTITIQLPAVEKKPGPMQLHSSNLLKKMIQDRMSMLYAFLADTCKMNLF